MKQTSGGLRQDFLLLPRALATAALMGLAALTHFAATTPVAHAAACASSGLGSNAIAAVKAADKGRLARALALAGNDAATRKTAHWLWLRRNLRQASAAQLLSFALQNPRWPMAGTFRAMGELKLLLDGSNADLASYFSRNKPRSAAGMVALARHLLSIGKRKQARAALKKAWRRASLPTTAEAYVRKHAGLDALLNASDDAARLWRLIMAQKTRHAVQFARNMPSAYRRAAAAARALMRRQRGALAQYRALPAAMRGKQAVRYALTRYYRKTGQMLKALSVLKGLPTSHAHLLAPEQWWTEKRLVARYLLANRYRRHWPDAYRLAASHGFSRPGKPAFRGEFLAGFIAFEKLGRPKTALKHFLRLPKLAKSRTWKAKGWYWVGRARERLDDLAGARRAYQASALTPTVYYGLLSREKLGLGHRPIPLKMAWPTPAARCKVQGHELGKAVRLLARAGNRRLLRGFVWPLAYSFHKPVELAAAASLLWDASGPANAVRLAKAAGSRGIDIDNYGYPLRALPPHKSRENTLELPVVLALIRQESEFDHTAGSHVGAQGLMQLMPATARLEARHLRVRYNRAWLTTRPAYNLLLGRHHLARVMENFGGSYALAFAAYNAGGGNVRKWLKAYGDLRTGSPDPVEWVELIPITETRNYVQKVLQGVHVYRTRLKRPMIPISRDLWRGVPGWRELVLRGGKGKPSSPPRTRRPASTIPTTPRGSPRPAGGDACGGGANGIDDLIRKC